jgi:hypothetical protein
LPRQSCQRSVKDLYLWTHWLSPLIYAFNNPRNSPVTKLVQIFVCDIQATLIGVRGSFLELSYGVRLITRATSTYVRDWFSSFFAKRLQHKYIFFVKSTFPHAGQRENKSFFHAGITFFHAGITFFSRWNYFLSCWNYFFHAGITFFSRWNYFFSRWNNFFSRWRKSRIWIFRGGRELN